MASALSPLAIPLASTVQTIAEENCLWAECVGRRVGRGRDIKGFLYPHHISFSASVIARRIPKMTGWVNCFWNKCVSSHWPPPPFGLFLFPISLLLSIPLHAYKLLLSLSDNTDHLTRLKKKCIHIALTIQGAALSSPGWRIQCWLATISLPSHTLRAF